MKRPLLICSGAFVLGEMLGLYQLTGGRTIFIGLAVVLILLTDGMFVFLRGISKAYLLIPLIFFTGFIWSLRNTRLPGEFPKTEMAVSGKVKWMEEGRSGRSLYLLPNSLWEGEAVLVYLKPGQNAGIGMEVRAYGTVEGFSAARNPGEFDRSWYYAAKKTRLRMFCERLEIINAKENRYKSGLYGIKSHTAKILEQICREGDDGLFKGILLGEGGAVPGDIKTLYQRSGIVHLLAISGLHISLLGMSLYKGQRSLGAPYLLSCTLSSFVMISFGIMTGSGVSVKRAVIMFLIHMAGDWLGRSYDMLTAAGISALLIFIDNPLALSSSGAQLSFLSLLGIGIGGEAIRQAAPEGRLAGTLAASLGIQLFTLPASLFHFFEYPRYGVFLNLLVIPLMSPVVLSGILGILFGSFHIPAGTFFIGLGHYILFLYQWLADFFLRLPGAVHITGRPPWVRIFLYYLVLLVFLAILAFIRRYYHQKVLSRLVIPLTFFLIYCGFLPLLKPEPVKTLEIRMIDVGQGDGILIRSPTGRNFLIDGGSSDMKAVGENRIVPYLKYLGVSRIDCIFLSHMDMDHINGVGEMMDQEDGFGIKIQALAVTLGTVDDEGFADLSRQAVKKGIPVLELQAGDEVRDGGFIMRCLFPDGRNEFSSDNDGSMVLHLEYGGFKALFTGDLEKKGELYLLQQGLSHYHLLKAGHHGSKTSSNQVFLAAVMPDAALISCGISNRYGHPHETVLTGLAEAGSKVYLTPESGAITVRTDGRQFWVETYLQ